MTTTEEKSTDENSDNFKVKTFDVAKISKTISLNKTIDQNTTYSNRVDTHLNRSNKTREKKDWNEEASNGDESPIKIIQYAKNLQEKIKQRANNRHKK